jgi:TolB-like protein
MATSLAVVGSASAQQLRTALYHGHLDSWKEIASFFARTIRTVQRWERVEDLPVYRHVHLKRSSVYALESELIAWRDTRSRQQDESLLRKKAPNRRLRLAVLPFANLSADPKLRHFEDGLTYEIIAQLARLDPARIGVIACTSVMPFKKSRCGIAQIGRRLSVDYVLEGSVRLAARKMRIAAQLTTSATKPIFSVTPVRDRGRTARPFKLPSRSESQEWFASICWLLFHHRPEARRIRSHPVTLAEDPLTSLLGGDTSARLRWIHPREIDPRYSPPKNPHSLTLKGIEIKICTGNSQ